MMYYTLTQQRNRRFCAEVWRECRLPESRGVDFRALVKRVIQRPVAKGHYITVDHLLWMDRARRNGTLPKMTPLRTRMWDDLFAQLDAHRAAHPEHTIVEAATEVIANGTAARYYFGMCMAMRILRNNMKGGDAA